MRIVFRDSDFTEKSWERISDELDIDIRSSAIIFYDINEYQALNKMTGEIFDYRQVKTDEQWNEYMKFEEIYLDDERANDKKYNWEIVFIKRRKRWRGMAISTNYRLRRNLNDNEEFSYGIKREVKKYEDIEKVKAEIKDVINNKQIINRDDKMLALNKSEFEKILKIYKNIMGYQIAEDELFKKEETFINILFD